jgi:uncharacterized repeat protein (TIGR03803 family)
MRKFLHLDNANSGDKTDGERVSPKAETGVAMSLKNRTRSVRNLWIGAILALALAATASASTEKVIHGFSYPLNGSQPLGSLIFDAHGNLYGVTSLGGGNNAGTVFELTPTATGWTQKVLHSFHGGADGAIPVRAGLVMDSAGNLYGATLEGGNNACSGGCGVIFELKPVSGGWTESVIYSFQGGADGSSPSGVTLDRAGNLFGTTGGGGTSSLGTAFQLVPAAGTWKKNILYSFKGGSDGSSPAGGVIFDSSGNLYGSTEFGASGFGTAFELVRSTGWTERILYAFQGGTTDTAHPQGALTFDTAGDLFGTTDIGGVFELTPVSGGWTESVIFAFSNPQQTEAFILGGGVVLDGAGDVFGATYQNGVFELTHGSGGWTETAVRPTNAYIGGLIFDSAGNLYGADSNGGTNTSLGVVFKLTFAASTWTSTTIYSFRDGCPENPIGGLIFDAAGNLYGTALNSGAFASGAVFELTRTGSTWTQKSLYNFRGGNDGAHPFGSLVFDGSGNLYGATASGGLYNSGTVFELSPNSPGGWTKATLHSFCKSGGAFCADGSEVVNDAAMIFDAAGNLYGTTPAGGAGGHGTLFKLTHASLGWTETVLSSFCNCASGADPMGGVVFGPDGNLYGAMQFGGGVGSNGGGVYEFNLATNTRTLLYAFRGSAHDDGENPEDGLTFDGSGNLYGTTSAGGTQSVNGTQSQGTVFELIPGTSGWTEKVLYTFKGGTDGEGPSAGVIFDTAGNLYGTTQNGGSPNNPPFCLQGCGTVFKLSPGSGGWTETQLYAFKAGQDGASPSSGVILDSMGNLYGETGFDTTGNAGAVFEVTP